MPIMCCLISTWILLATHSLTLMALGNAPVWQRAWSVLQSFNDVLIAKPYTIQYRQLSLILISIINGRMTGGRPPYQYGEASSGRRQCVLHAHRVSSPCIKL